MAASTAGSISTGCSTNRNSPDCWRDAMPNAMVPFAPMAAADSTQPLPSLVAQALRQAERDDHPDVPWQPPARLPDADALKVALAMLTPRPADDRTIAACLAA